MPADRVLLFTWFLLPWVDSLRHRKDVDVIDASNADHREEAATPTGAGTTESATDYSAPVPFQAAVSRRRFLSLGGTAAGVAITAGATGSRLGLAASKPHRLTGTI